MLKIAKSELGAKKRQGQKRTLAGIKNRILKKYLTKNAISVIIVFTMVHNAVNFVFGWWRLENI